jgi:hypothetical protein
MRWLTCSATLKQSSSSPAFHRANPLASKPPPADGIGTHAGNGSWRIVFEGERFERDRNGFLLPNIATAIAFVKLCQPIKNPVLTSYGLKHVAERWGERNGMEPYVANGEFIVAAIYLGVPVKPIELGRNLNALVGLARRRVQELDPDCIWASNFEKVRLENGCAEGGEVYGE